MLPTRTPLAILAAAIVSCPWRMLVAAAPAEGDELGVEHPAAPSSCSAPPHQRASCFTQTWDHQPQLVPSGASTDGPLVGNGDMGAVAAGQPGTISLFTGKNDFWGVRDVPNGGCPCEPSPFHPILVLAFPPPHQPRMRVSQHHYNLTSIGSVTAPSLLAPPLSGAPLRSSCCATTRLVHLFRPTTSTNPAPQHSPPTHSSSAAAIFPPTSPPRPALP